MTITQIFNYSNLAFLIVSLIACKEVRNSALKLNSPIKIFRAFLLSALLAFSTIYFSLNIYLLLCSISLFNSRSSLSMKTGRIVNTNILYAFVACLILLISILSFFVESVIWAPAVLNILHYFLLFALAYSIDQGLDARSSALRVAILLFVSIFFMSKIGLALAAVALIALILKFYRSRALIKIIPLIMSLLCLLYIAKSDFIVSQIADRFVREDYQRDEKYFGLSDGGRSFLWTYYLDNSQPFGAGKSLDGTIYSSIPSHNIFIAVAHSAGYVLAYFVALLILCSLFNMLITGFHCFSLAILFSLMFSSFGEFPLMWLSCILFLPLAVTKT